MTKFYLLICNSLFIFVFNLRCDFQRFFKVKEKLQQKTFMFIIIIYYKPVKQNEERIVTHFTTS